MQRKKINYFNYSVYLNGRIDLSSAAPDLCGLRKVDDFCMRSSDSVGQTNYIVKKHLGTRIN